MRDLDAEFEQIKAQSLGLSWLKEPCVSVCEIIEITDSSKIDDYTGKPYFEFLCKTDRINPDTEEPLHIKCRFGRVYAGLSDKAKEIRLQQLKEFLTNANADFSKKGMEILMSVKGNSVKCLFRNREYIGVDKDANNKPVIKTILEYGFSTGPTDDIKSNESYFFKGLRDQDKGKLSAQLADWKRDNPDFVETPSAEIPVPEVSGDPARPVEEPGNTEADDDLPF
jgi:hypothetical protein